MTYDVKNDLFDVSRDWKNATVGRSHKLKRRGSLPIDAETPSPSGFRSPQILSVIRRSGWTRKEGMTRITRSLLFCFSKEFQLCVALPGSDRRPRRREKHRKRLSARHGTLPLSHRRKRLRRSEGQTRSMSESRLPPPRGDRHNGALTAVHHQLREVSQTVEGLIDQQRRPQLQGASDLSR